MLLSILSQRIKATTIILPSEKTLFNPISQYALVNFLNPKDANNTPIITGNILLSRGL